MELTREKLIEGIEFCLHCKNCGNNCPIYNSCTGLSSVLEQCLPYVEGKENELAPIGVGTSSVVGDTTNILHLDCTTVSRKCQDVYYKLLEAFDNDLESSSGLVMFGEALGMFKVLIDNLEDEGMEE